MKIILCLLLAATLWSCVGTAVLLAGARWNLGAAGATGGSLLIALGAAAGLLKGRFVLDRAALRIADRIASRGDGRCASQFTTRRNCRPPSGSRRATRGVLASGAAGA